MKNEYFGTQQVHTCAKVVILVKWKTLGLAPVVVQVQILECKRLAPIIQCQSNMCQVEIFLFD
jgi:hypothetical protein